MEIQILRRQGKSLREIAQETGVAVNTVRKYLAEESAPRYGPRATKPGKLEPFRAYLIARVEAARWKGVHSRLTTIISASHIRTQLDPFTPEEQGHLINWGYCVCDTSLRRWIPDLLPVNKKGAFPIPEFPI